MKHDKHVKHEHDRDIHIWLQPLACLSLPLGDKGSCQFTNIQHTMAAQMKRKQWEFLSSPDQI